MPLDTAVTERAARILIERDPGPGDRLDAFLLLAGQEYLWRRRDRPGADFGEAVRMYEAAAGRRLPRPTSLPFFGAVKRRRIERRREVAVWLAGRFLGWLYSPDGRGRASDTDWRPVRQPVDLPGAAVRDGPEGASPFASPCRASRDRARSRERRRPRRRGCRP